MPTTDPAPGPYLSPIERVLYAEGGMSLVLEYRMARRGARLEAACAALTGLLAAHPYGTAHRGTELVDQAVWHGDALLRRLARVEDAEVEP